MEEVDPIEEDVTAVSTEVDRRGGDFMGVSGLEKVFSGRPMISSEGLGTTSKPSDWAIGTIAHHYRTMKTRRHVRARYQVEDSILVTEVNKMEMLDG